MTRHQHHHPRCFLSPRVPVPSSICRSHPHPGLSCAPVYLRAHLDPCPHLNLGSQIDIRDQTPVLALAMPLALPLALGSMKRESPLPLSSCRWGWLLCQSFPCWQSPSEEQMGALVIVPTIPAPSWAGEEPSDTGEGHPACLPPAGLSPDSFCSHYPALAALPWGPPSLSIAWRLHLELQSKEWVLPVWAGLQKAVWALGSGLRIWVLGVLPDSSVTCLLCH